MLCSAAVYHCLQACSAVHNEDVPVIRAHLLHQLFVLQRSLDIVHIDGANSSHSVFHSAGINTQFAIAAQEASVVSPAGANTYTVPQPVKALPSTAQPAGSLISFSPVQPLKAFGPMEVT